MYRKHGHLCKQTSLIEIEPLLKGINDMTIKISQTDRKNIQLLASYGLRDNDICALYDFSEATLKRHFASELKKGRAKAKSRVMHTAYELAVSGKCPTMTIFWLKTRCGWTEFDERKINENEEERKSANKAEIEKQKQMFLQELMQISSMENKNTKIDTKTPQNDDKTTNH